MINQEEQEEQVDSKKMEDQHFCQDFSNVIQSQEINNKEHDIIKGDTVGETLYSAKWILNTLISLSKVYEDGWNESVESDLCTLWDMTAEKDIVTFLLENDFYKLAEFTLKISEEPRLTEIIVGIIGNMCCEEESLKALVDAEELVSFLISLITSDDKETLIQILRVLQAAVWHIQKDSNSAWLKKIENCGILNGAITFILKSSTSDELLTPTIDFVYLLSETELSDKGNFFECLFNIDQLIFSLCESIMELVNQTDNTHTEIQFKNIENWFNIIFNILKKNLLIFSNKENDENFLKINAVLLRILRPYSDCSNLIPSEDSCILCIQQSVQMLFYFQKYEVNPAKELIQIILKILVNLKQAIAEDQSKNNSDFKELYKYIVGYWVEILKVMKADEIATILSSCDLETVNDIIETANNFSVPKENMNEFLEAKSIIFSL